MQEILLMRCVCNSKLLKFKLRTDTIVSDHIMFYLFSYMCRTLLSEENLVEESFHFALSERIEDCPNSDVWTKQASCQRFARRGIQGGGLDRSMVHIKSIYIYVCMCRIISRSSSGVQRIEHKLLTLQDMEPIRINYRR